MIVSNPTISHKKLQNETKLGVAAVKRVIACLTALKIVSKGT